MVMVMMKDMVMLMLDDDDDNDDDVDDDDDDDDGAAGGDGDGDGDDEWKGHLRIQTPFRETLEVLIMLILQSALGYFVSIICSRRFRTFHNLVTGTKKRLKG